MFKVKNGLCPEIMRDIFQLNTDPNSRTTFLIPKVKGEYMGKLTLRYFGPVVWETMLPKSYKDITVLEKFKIISGNGYQTVNVGCVKHMLLD